MSFDYRVAFQSFQNMAVGFLRALPYILVALIVFALFYITAKTLRRVITQFTQSRKKHRNAGLVLGRLAEGGIMLLGILVALMIAIPSFKPGQLIQILGIGSVAIGFAFRDILQNFLAGLLILLTEPFRIDDQIIIGNYEGTVENIETRATFLRTYDGRRVVIPNSTLVYRLRPGQHGVFHPPLTVRHRNRLRRRYTGRSEAYPGNAQWNRRRAEGSATGGIGRRPCGKHR